MNAADEPSSLTRDTILRGLQLLSDRLGQQGVKGFVSSRYETTAGTLPQFEHLRLTMPVPEYLLAMKRMAARLGGTAGEPSDVADIVFLARHLNLKSAHEVLDEFKTAPSEAAWAAEPMSLKAHAGTRGAVQDAYLAATAEHLAWQHRLSVPAWVRSDERKLRRPWFASPLAALRAVLILESPAAFRSRNVFVSENALSRA